MWNSSNKRLQACNRNPPIRPLEIIQVFRYTHKRGAALG
jgi:hypothetical protein